MAHGTNNRAAPRLTGSFKFRLEFHWINPLRFEAVGVAPTSNRPVKRVACKKEAVRRYIDKSARDFVGRSTGIVGFAVTNDAPEAASEGPPPAAILNEICRLSLEQTSNAAVESQSRTNESATSRR